MPVWNQALKILNATTSNPDSNLGLARGQAVEESIPFSHSLEEDLLALNQKELTNISVHIPKASDRKAKNTFIHNEAQKLNQLVIMKLQGSTSQSTERRDYRAAAKSALLKISSNEITRPENILKFKDGDQIGFCFSRALLIHYLLLKSGVPQSEIAKIFMIGDLRVGGVMWQFHTAILLRDPTEGFIVVDPLHDKLIPFKEWMKISSEMDIKAPFSRVRFYVTPPNKFLPSSGAYDLNTLQHPILKQYSNAITAFF